MIIQPGKIYDLKYSIYWGHVQVIPCTNKIKVLEISMAEYQEDEVVKIISIEHDGLHGDRELTIDKYDFLRAVGEIR